MAPKTKMTREEVAADLQERGIKVAPHNRKEYKRMVQKHVEQFHAAED